MECLRTPMIYSVKVAFAVPFSAWKRQFFPHHRLDFGLKKKLTFGEKMWPKSALLKCHKNGWFCSLCKSKRRPRKYQKHRWQESAKNGINKVVRHPSPRRYKFVRDTCSILVVLVGMLMTRALLQMCASSHPRHLRQEMMHKQSMDSYSLDCLHIQL